MLHYHFTFHHLNGYFIRNSLPPQILKHTITLRDPVGQNKQTNKKHSFAQMNKAENS